VSNVLFFDRIAELEREHASFAIATVVARCSPVSSHLDDRALVFGDGHMEGFVGGSCSRDIVRRHALDAILKRRPLLLQIRPDGGSPGAGASTDDSASANTERVVIPMSCSSEGAVDVYIEPRVPLRRLVVVGFTPVAQALARIAVALDYDVVRVVADSELRDLGDAVAGVHVVELKALRAFLDALDERAQHDLVAVVASQGHYDELALEVLVKRPSAFTGLLASRRRAASVAGVLAQQGLASERVAADSQSGRTRHRRAQPGRSRRIDPGPNHRAGPRLFRRTAARRNAGANRAGDRPGVRHGGGHRRRDLPLRTCRAHVFLLRRALPRDIFRLAREFSCAWRDVTAERIRARTAHRGPPALKRAADTAGIAARCRVKAFPASCSSASTISRRCS
jgi:xanthine/CO dehydrogenase XdhC/CoxF family maturation factor